MVLATMCQTQSDLNDLLKVRTISGLNIEEIKGKETNSNKVYTNWGFTHGQGLLEAKSENSQ